MPLLTEQQRIDGQTIAKRDRAWMMNPSDAQIEKWADQVLVEHLAHWLATQLVDGEWRTTCLSCGGTQQDRAGRVCRGCKGTGQVASVPGARGDTTS